MAERYIVSATDWLIPALAGHAGWHYQSPPHSEEQARALVRLLAGAARTPDGDGPWERAVAGGRRSVTLQRCNAATTAELGTGATRCPGRLGADPASRSHGARAGGRRIGPAPGGATSPEEATWQPPPVVQPGPAT